MARAATRPLVLSIVGAAICVASFAGDGAFALFGMAATVAALGLQPSRPRSSRRWILACSVTLALMGGLRLTIAALRAG